jgi:hypothetical protein
VNGDLFSAGGLTPSKAAGPMDRLRDAGVSENREGMVQANPAMTSASAARLVEPRSGTQRARLLAYVVEAPSGATGYEGERNLGLLGNSLRPRRIELATDGYVTDSGRTRRHRGSDWVVWEATDEARAWYARTILKESA